MKSSYGLNSNYSINEASGPLIVASTVYADYHAHVPQYLNPLGRTSFGRVFKQQFPTVKLVRRNLNNCRVFQYVGLIKKVRTATSQRKPLVDVTNTFGAALDNSDESSNESTFASDSSDEEYVPPLSARSPQQHNSQYIISQLKALLPATLASDPKWMDFLTEQVNNCGSYRRWSISVIQLAMDIFTRSPKAYANVSKVLRLPSTTQLLRYKYFVKQQPGIVHENLHWMLLEADRREVTREGRSGFIVFDEMSIQPDLQMESPSATTELVGFTDYGDAQGLHMLCRTGGKHTLATHVLQFMFLGFQGFSWPVCYYSTTEAHASELMVLVWKVVNAVQLYGFQIEGMLMDGGANNRKFVKLHFPNGSDILQTDFRLQNPIHTSHYVSVMMDPSHGIKKLRNSCFASQRQSRQRRLRWGRNFVLWEHWEQAYAWNEATPSFKIYHKLSEQHIFLTDSGKMRNHLAMEVLNSEMLHLMQEFQKATGRVDLELTLRLLKHTSRLVNSFTSNRPILNITDDRLAANSQALEFFQQWYASTKTDPSSFITKECFDDLTSTIISFNNIVSKRLQRSASNRVVPSIMNSDIIENFFCSQRGRCNGANTNPTVLAYSKAINTLLLTTDRQRSAKRNACSDASVGGAHPYKTLAKRTFRR